MKKSEFYYDLPPELVAQTPAEPRDSARLLAYNMQSGAIEHRRFTDICAYLRKGDVLVVNNTRVIPARLDGVKQGSGGKMEFLLLKRLDLTRWEIMVKPGKKAGIGTRFVFGQNGELQAEIISKTDSGGRIAEFTFDGVFEDVLARIGQTPLPHYIKDNAQLKEITNYKLQITNNDKEINNNAQLLKRYNTVYAKTDGSAAAPTAGLHFTPALLEKIKGMGVEVAEVLLHVGLGTFRPVKTESIEQHKMHCEYCEISESAANVINKAKREGRRVIAVGTTSVRTLESSCHYTIKHGSRETDIFIYPPYKFKIVDALITNFHLPESTLLMLLAAFIGDKGKKDGIKAVADVYQNAIKERYRFFSFGDSSIFF